MPKLAVPLGDVVNTRPAELAKPSDELLRWRLPQLAVGGRTDLGKARRDLLAKIRTPAEVAVPDGCEVVTYSELDAFRQCPLKHQLGYVARWTKEAKEGSPLHRGSAWHALMEVYYGVLGLHEARRRLAKRDELWALIQVGCYPLLADERGHSTDQQILLTWMLQGYWECYGVEEDWEVLLIEKAGRLRLDDPVTGEPTRFFFQFKLDLLVFDKRLSRLLLVDHKSAGQFRSRVEIDIDDQFGLYTWALRQFGVDVFGSVKSDARTQRNVGPMKLDQRFKRQQSFRTAVELRNIELDLVETARAAWDQPHSVRSSPNPTQCGWKCDFLETHLLMRKGVPVEKALGGYGFWIRDVRHREYNADDGGAT